MTSSCDNYSCSVCDAMRNCSVDIAVVLECSLKSLLRPNMAPFFFFFMCVLKKIPPKLNFLIVEGEDRKAILEF